MLIEIDERSTANGTKLIEMCQNMMMKDDAAK